MVAELSGYKSTNVLCLCVPLRLGVLLAALLGFITSLIYVCNYSHWEWVFRHWVGGYTLASRVILGFIEVTGLWFTLLGMFGVWYQKRDHIFYFNMWQIARLLVWVPVWCLDGPVLGECESWVLNIDGMKAQYGWNPVMFDFAMSGACGDERQKFIACSIVLFVVFLYIICGVQQYLDLMSSVPKHMLHVPKGIPDTAFYAHSRGTRSYMRGYQNPEEAGPLLDRAGNPMPGGEDMVFAPAPPGNV